MNGCLDSDKKPGQTHRGKAHKTLLFLQAGGLVGSSGESGADAAQELGFASKQLRGSAEDSYPPRRYDLWQEEKTPVLKLGLHLKVSTGRYWSHRGCLRLQTACVAWREKRPWKWSQLFPSPHPVKFKIAEALAQGCLSPTLLRRQ